MSLDLPTAIGATAGTVVGGGVVVVGDSIAKEIAEGDTRDAGDLIAVGAGVGAGVTAAVLRTKM